MENITKLKNIVENEVLKLEYFNDSFINSYAIAPVIKDFTFKFENDCYMVDFVLNDEYAYTNQSAGIRIFTFNDEHDFKLGFTIEQIQKDILNNIYAYIGISENDENLIKFINLAEVNENIFKKHGFSKRDKFRMVPNTINISTSEEKTTWAYCYTALYLADAINIAKVTSEKYFQTHNQFINKVVASYNNENLDTNVHVFSELATNSLGLDTQASINDTRWTTNIYKINKNQEYFNTYSVYTNLGSRHKMLINHRSLFGVQVVFASKEFNLLPTNEQVNSENIEFTRNNIEIEMFEKILQSSREEVFNFDDELKDVIFKFLDAILQPQEIVKALTSTNRLAQRKANKLLDIFEDEDMIVDILELLFKWVNINRKTLKYTNKLSLFKVENIIEDIDIYLDEIGKYVLLDIQKVKLEFTDVDFSYYDIEKIIDMLTSDIEVSTDARAKMKIYFGNMFAIYDLFRNINTLPTLKRD